MKKTFLILLVAVLFAFPVTANVFQDADVSIGIGLGDSVHLTTRLDLDRTMSAVFNVGFGYGQAGGLYFRPQYQHAMSELEFDIDIMRFYPYVGAAVPMAFGGDGFDLGVSGVAGLSYYFANAPLEIYVEALPGMRLMKAGEINAGFGIGGGIGLRYSLRR